MYVAPTIFFFFNFLFCLFTLCLLFLCFCWACVKLRKDGTFFYQLSTLEIRLDLIDQNQGVDWIGLD